MRTAHGYFEGVSGLRLHYQSWEILEPRAALLISPGLGEHSGRYATLAADLAEHGVSVYALDHRGHGQSDGRRGHVERFDLLVQDLERFRREILGLLGPHAPPVFLLGHSLGGLIALRYLQEFSPPLQGVVLSAPLLGVAVRGSPWKHVLAGVLARLAPALRLSNEIDPTLLTQDVNVVSAYTADPLVHSWITPRMYSEMLRALAMASELSTVSVPLLILVPEGDRIVDPQPTTDLALRLRGDVTLQRYPGMYHELLNEVERDRVVSDVVSWIDARIADSLPL